jgi:hypothetical protein
MKQIIAACVILTLAIPALASPVQQGIFCASFGISSDVAPSDEDLGPKLQVGLGYAAWTDVEVGGYMTFGSAEWESFWSVGDVWGLGVYAEYNYPSAQTMVPYVGVSLEFRNASGAANASGAESDVVAVGGLAAGLKIFPDNAIALTFQLGLEFAGDDIFDYDRMTDEGDAYGFRASIGLRMYH